jgi:hypothetical protein
MITPPDEFYGPRPSTHSSYGRRFCLDKPRELRSTGMFLGTLVHYEVDFGPPLLPKILTTTIAPINLKCATLTVSEKSVINHEFRIPNIFGGAGLPCNFTPLAALRRWREKEGIDR